MSDDLSSLSMMDLFRMEAETQVGALNEGLLALEGDPAAAHAHAETLMRAAHSLKGAARLVNLDLAVQVSHVMEDVFVAVQEKGLPVDAEGVDTLLKSIDFLTGLSKLSDQEVESWCAAQKPAADALIASLRAILTPGAKKPAPASPPPASAPAAPARVELPDDLSGLSMMDLFRMEAETQVGALNEGLLALESDPAAAPAHAETLMRAAHSLKGAARLVNLELAVEVAHVMEDVFVAVQEKGLPVDPDGVDTLLKSLDFLTSLSKLTDHEVESWSVAHKQEVAGLVASLRAILTPGAKKATPLPPAPPASPAPSPAVGPEATVPAPAAPAKKETASAASSPARPESADRVVRVGAENLNRLMELAAESLVEAKRMKPFADSLLELKATHADIETELWGLRENLEHDKASRHSVPRLVELESRVEAMRQVITRRLEDFEQLLRRTSGLSDRLYHEVIASRMRPFGDGVGGFPRMIRDLSRQLGKKVKFNILGKTTDVDRDILEKLEAPLNHILRNALDHGVEPPEQRLASGKKEEAELKLEARHGGGMLYIDVSDDGRGVDRDRLRRKIIDKGMVPAEAAAKLEDWELLEFLFLPGFSTAEKITEISGRGVGLDVVQNMLQEVGGTVRIVSHAGKGTTFHLQLPITRSVMRALIVDISGQSYAFPLPRIDRVLRVQPDKLETVEGRTYVKADGKNIGLVPASQVLELPQLAKSDGELAILVVSDRNQQYGLEVDSFLGERDLVVRPLDPRLGKVPDMSAASVLEDGSPILIVDVDDLVRSIDTLLAGGRLGRTRREAETAAKSGSKRVLVTDDSITVRELERQLLKSHGYDVEVAVDGMEGWNAVRLGQYDLVVTDVDMPRMTGIDFVKLIRNDDRLKVIPVIIVSYKDREEDRLRGLEAGANYYLTKSSFQDDTFLNAVQDLIGRAKE